MPVSTTPTLPAGLPPLDEHSAEHGLTVQRYLIQQIRATSQGFMPFDQWMDLALYAPGLGYYSAGSSKFSAAASGGDFTTAPELTPLFGQTLARQVAQIAQASGSNAVLEFGAGSGALADSLIPALRALGHEPIYSILEISPDLRERQRQRLAPLNAQIEWLDTLPTQFAGCVLGNELLDAMPVKLFSWQQDSTLVELGVTVADDRAGRSEKRHDEKAPTDAADALATSPFRLVSRPADPTLSDAVASRVPLFPGYQSEVNLRAEAWIREMATWLTRGAALLIDYGFPQHEYYHPQRAEGTLMCHFRHHAHSQPLIYPGLQDITAHVDFTAMADAALDAGLDVLGYTSQARFLANTGITSILAQLDPGDVTHYAQTVAPVQKLLAESEMGELFKVLAVGRDIDVPLLGFIQGDRRHRL